MLVRLAAFSFFVLAGAAVLVAPSRPGAPGPEPVPLAESAIALLGETWTLAAPEPVVIPPAAAPGADAQVEHAAPHPIAQGTAPVAPEARGADIAALRTPLRRPVGLSAGRALGPSEQVARRRAEPEADGLRWIVRDQGTGAVLAELPLDEALALMQARSLRP
jgi:hypothetical protein